MNKIMLIGNLTADPEASQTPNGISYCRFSLAVGRRFSNQDGEKETDFFNVVAWRGLGDNIQRYLKKGNKACVCGALQIRRYEDKDGNNKTFVEVVADDVEFLTPKGMVNSDYDDEQSPKSSAASKPKKTPSIKDLQPVEDDGLLPF